MEIYAFKVCMFYISYSLSCWYFSQHDSFWTTDKKSQTLLVSNYYFHSSPENFKGLKNYIYAEFHIRSFLACGGGCMHAWGSPGSVDDKGHWTKSKGLLVSASQCGLAASSQPGSIHGWPSLHDFFFSPSSLLILQTLSAYFSIHSVSLFWPVLPQFHAVSVNQLLEAFSLCYTFVCHFLFLKLQESLRV